MKQIMSYEFFIFEWNDSIRNKLNILKKKLLIIKILKQLNIKYTNFDNPFDNTIFVIKVLKKKKIIGVI